MGNTWARYWLLDPEPFEARFLAFPETLTVADWQSLVEGLPEQDLLGYPVDRDSLLAADAAAGELVAAPGGMGRLLSTEAAAQAVLEACLVACGRRSFKAADVCHAFWDGADLLRTLRTDADREAWRALCRLLGFPSRPRDATLPWWLQRAYGRDHWMALTAPADLAAALQAHLSAPFLAELLGAVRVMTGNPNLRHAAVQLGSFLSQASTEPGWLLALESCG